MLAKALWVSAKYRSKKSRLPFTITVDDILEMIGKDGKCPVFDTAYPLDTRRVCDESATLDKRIPELGYTRENCAVISWLANTIKSKATAGQVLRTAQWMYQQAAA
jgi:hypothetical protein